MRKKKLLWDGEWNTKYTYKKRESASMTKRVPVNQETHDALRRTYIYVVAASCAGYTDTSSVCPGSPSPPAPKSPVSPVLRDHVRYCLFQCPMDVAIHPDANSTCRVRRKACSPSQLSIVVVSPCPLSPVRTLAAWPLTPLQLETRFWGQNYLDLVLGGVRGL